MVAAFLVVDAFMIYRLFLYTEPTSVSGNGPVKTLNPTTTPTVTPIISSTTPTPVAKPTPDNQNLVLLNVPFTAQAPFGDWSDPRQQDACEEASIIMAMAWVRNKGFTLQEALQSIIEMAEWELANYGFYQDTSATDTAKLIKDYFGYTNTEVRKGINANDILAELEKGNLVIVPTNGQRLGNPNFTDGGPPVHMIVVKGYDYNTGEFITNDPGTRKGENYRYSTFVLNDALQDYPTGNHHGPQITGDTAMIIVRK